MNKDQDPLPYFKFILGISREKRKGETRMASEEQRQIYNTSYKPRSMHSHNRPDIGPETTKTGSRSTIY